MAAMSVDQAIERATFVYHRVPKPTYNQNGRKCDLNASTYDCSSFIGTVWNISSIPSTFEMETVYLATHNFESFTYHQGFKFVQGDILVGNNRQDIKPDNGHTMMVFNEQANLFIQASGGLVPTLTGFYTPDYGWESVIRTLGDGPGKRIYIAGWTPTDGIDDGF